MKSDKYFKIRDVNLGPKQIQSQAKEQFEQKMKMREVAIDETKERMGLVSKADSKVSRGITSLQGSNTGPTSQNMLQKRGLTGQNKSILDEGLGNLGTEFEKELEKRFEIIDR